MHRRNVLALHAVLSSVCAVGLFAIMSARLHGQECSIPNNNQCPDSYINPEYWGGSGSTASCDSRAEGANRIAPASTTFT